MQKRINKIFILLIFFSHTLFGCALCTIYSPETKVSIKVNVNKEKIDTAKITWVFAKDFSDQLKEIYDLNQNNYLDKGELIPIEQSLLDYIVPKNYLTHISYDKIINKNKSLKVKIKSKRSYIKNSRLHFEYQIDLNLKVIKDNILYIKIDDEQKYFILLIVENQVSFNAPFEYQKVIDKKSVAFFIEPSKEKTEETLKVISEIDEEKTIKASKTTETTYLERFSKKVKEYLVKIENGDDYALFILLGISFLYGIIHALGPGHGKSLAFSYFVSNKSSYFKAFLISQASAFIHILGALILVVISIFLLQSILNNFVNDSVEILTKTSAVMIILLAIYILYNKFNNKSCSCSSCCTSENKAIWSTSAPKFNALKLSFEKPKFMKKDLYFVLTAGLIPCPGTVILFIYAFMLKTYFAVILASIFISFGMGLVIFASSFIGVSVYNLSQRSHRITNSLEILAPMFMFLLGVLLFFNAQLI